jgi:ABC-type nitrate/sulfonate/bicarbonate transport system substrate-binding protein
VYCFIHSVSLRALLGKGSRVIWLVALLASLWFAAPARAEATLQDVTIALPAFSLSFSSEYLAEDMGFYAKRGLHAKIIEIAGVGAINAVISGSADFALPSAISLTRAAARGQRLLAIAETSDRVIVQVALRKDLAKGFDPAAPLAKRAALLRGRTIAVDAVNSLIHAYVLLLAQRAGIAPDDIHIAVMQPANMLAAFDAKQIDGFAMSPPWPLKPVLEGKAVLLASGPDGDPADLVPFANNLVVTRPQTCAERKKLCDGVGHAFAEAASFLTDHPDDALALLKKRFPRLDDKLLAAAFAVIRKITPVPPVVDEKGLENSEIFNVDAGLLKPEEKLKSYDGLATDQYVR